MGTLHLHFWGRLSDRFGPQRDIALASENASLRVAVEEALADDTALLFAPSVRVVVNGLIVTDIPPVKPGDRVEFLPPVGGG